MKADIPARGRALVQYALRDVKAEIAKGYNELKTRKRKISLASQPVAYAALEAAARK